MVTRIKSIDLLRGCVMALMAIDHVRVYSGMPAGGQGPALFFTRWITHFCVSGFVFFAGAGIFLHAKKINDPPALSRYLLIRGLLLMFLEPTFIRFCWTFNLNFSEFVLAGVIWMLGCCMVIMAGLVRLPLRLVGFGGAAIIIFQQVFAYFPSILPSGLQQTVAYGWNFFYPSDLKGFENIAILYSIIPWIGVMATGYGFGVTLLQQRELRTKTCYVVGGLATVLFIVIGSIMIITEQPPEQPTPFIFRLLNQNKYPASQLFLLMTLGPLIFFIPLAEKVKGWLANVLTIFGRVPLFYYLLHIPIIHLLALGVNFIRDGVTHQDWYGFAPFYTQQEKTGQWGLPLLYLVWLIVEVLLYWLCRWYGVFKAKQPGNTWLKYL